MAVVIKVQTAPDIRDVVHRGVQAIAEGKVVAFPTETVYGLAASALHEGAVEELLRLKQRGSGHPLSLALKHPDEALDYIPNMPPLAGRLVRRCWPGPVTLVMEDSHSDSLLRQLPAGVRQAVMPGQFVGFRVPAHRLLLEVLQLLPGPLALTSANRTGMPEAVTADDVVACFADEIPLVLDDGRCQFGQPSSVVQIQGDTLRVLRAGVVSEATLKRLASFMIIFVCTGNTCRSPMAEGICRRMLADILGCHPDQLEEMGVIVASAGISAASGGGPAPEAVQIAAEHGGNLSQHVSQPLGDRLAQHADIILAMTRTHREAIISMWPEVAERTELLCPDQTDVADPIGGPLETYRRCADQIAVALRRRLSEWTDGLLKWRLVRD